MLLLALFVPCQALLPALTGNSRPSTRLARSFDPGDNFSLRPGDDYRRNNDPYGNDGNNWSADNFDERFYYQPNSDQTAFDGRYMDTRRGPFSNNIGSGPRYSQSNNSGGMNSLANDHHRSYDAHGERRNAPRAFDNSGASYGMGYRGSSGPGVQQPPSGNSGMRGGPGYGPPGYNNAYPGVSPRPYGSGANGIRGNMYGGGVRSNDNINDPRRNYDPCSDYRGPVGARGYDPRRVNNFNDPEGTSRPTRGTNYKVYGNTPSTDPETNFNRRPSLSQEHHRSYNDVSRPGYKTGFNRPTSQRNNNNMGTSGYDPLKAGNNLSSNGMNNSQRNPQQQRRMNTQQQRGGYGSGFSTGPRGRMPISNPRQTQPDPFTGNRRHFDSMIPDAFPKDFGPPVTSTGPEFMGPNDRRNVPFKGNEDLVRPFEEPNNYPPRPFMEQPERDIIDTPFRNDNDPMRPPPRDQVPFNDPIRPPPINRKPPVTDAVIDYDSLRGRQLPLDPNKLYKDQVHEKYLDTLYSDLQSAPPGRNGWFIPSMEAFARTDVVFPGERFFCAPREYDYDLNDIPTGHPMRSIAKVLADAPLESTIGIYAQTLSDPYMIALIAHHAQNKNIQIILQPDNYSLNQIIRFCESIPPTPDGPSPREIFGKLVEFRVFNARTPACNERSSQHMSSIITDKVTLVGSYDFTVQARCKNRESMYALETTDYDCEVFDSDWKTLEGRVLDIFNPNMQLFQ